MKRVIALAAVVGAMLLVTGIGATAADGPSITQFRHLQRQVNQLDNRVDGLQGQVNVMRSDVRDLLYDVFGCSFPGDPLTSFTDGSYAYVLYYDVNCTSTYKPNGAGRQPAMRAGG